MKTIGILAVQGDFEKHEKVVASLGHLPAEVRNVQQLQKTDGLIIPGGESTTFLRLFREDRLDKGIIKYAESRPIMGTCAGLIILSRQSDNLSYQTLNLIDIIVKRNAYGRQKESFIDNVNLYLNGKQDKFIGVFIRAPKIVQTGQHVKILATYQNDPVLVRQNNILVATFHPELTNNPLIHKYFIDHFIAQAG